MHYLIQRREALLKRLVAGGSFVKGSIASVCGTCARSRCMCAKACATKAFRMTYKDARQKTHIVYIPRNRLAEMKRLIANYTRCAHCFSRSSIPTSPSSRAAHGQRDLELWVIESPHHHGIRVTYRAVHSILQLRA
jgi:hypothetical protein